MAVELKMPFSAAIDNAQKNFDAVHICAVASYIFLIVKQSGLYIPSEPINNAANQLLNRGLDLYDLPLNQKFAFLTDHIFTVPELEELEGASSHYEKDLKNCLSSLHKIMNASYTAVEQERLRNGQTNYEDVDDVDMTYDDNIHDSRVKDAAVYFSPVETLKLARFFGQVLVQTMPKARGKKENKRLIALEPFNENMRMLKNSRAQATNENGQNRILDLLSETGQSYIMLFHQLEEIGYKQPLMLIALHAMSELCLSYSHKADIIDFPTEEKHSAQIISFEERRLTK
ncbi:MAG: hypothetical protein CMH30_01285 [Micavibrio sp.]|nr:hypothetical protein [Micavibrio sp.]